MAIASNLRAIERIDLLRDIVLEGTNFDRTLLTLHVAFTLDRAATLILNVSEGYLGHDSILLIVGRTKFVSRSDSRG
jgi:hypothetical protein